MKKNYEAPSVEKIEFNYRDQVVAASGLDNNWLGASNTGCVYKSDQD